MFVEVALNLPPVRGTFHYHIPPELEDQIAPGHLITVPFGERQVQGVVLSLDPTAPVPETRPVMGLVNPRPVLTNAQIALARWLQKETTAPLSDCINLMIPSGLSQRADSKYSLVIPDAEGKTPTERKLIDLLIQRGPLRGRQLAHAFPRTAWHSAAETLLRRGVVIRTSILKSPSVHPRHVRTARLILPPEIGRDRVSKIGRSDSLASHRRRSIVELLILEGEPLEVAWIYAESGASLSDLNQLRDEGIIALSEAEVWRDPLAQMDFVPVYAPRLTTDQAKAWEPIRDQLHLPPDQPRKPFLLHGVTGSGKTEIYLRAVGETLALGHGAIVLVPEIALTPQTVRRFLTRFPGEVGLIHSQLSLGERFDTWRRCRSGDLKVVIGPRSALFTPMPNIRLIVLDECHDDSFKEQGQNPRYHARETALAYSQILGATCILGSATPDVITMYQAQKGKIEYLTLPQRILAHRQRIEGQSTRLGIKSHYRPAEAEADWIDLPPVRVVDMRQELRSGNRSIFSRALTKALAETLEAGHQAILFLNRRGSATYIFCRDCGEALQCPQCDTPLTFHRQQDQLLCHRCGYRRGLPKKCPRCKSTRIKQFGAGTQSIEAAVNHLFPAARTLRWDWDTTRKKGAHELILAHFAAHRADVLIGTQMIAKGLDLPLVTLVGVVSADVGLNLPDYRASERTFQVLTQVSGRAGRGLLGGQVVLQTYQPEHYAIRAASQHDYLAFYQKEIEYRRHLVYPPFQRLARLLYKNRLAHVAQAESQKVGGLIRSKLGSTDFKAELIGPVPCFFEKLGGEYRWQIIIRASEPTQWIPEPLPEGWIVDIDPVSLL